MKRTRLSYCQKRDRFVYGLLVVLALAALIAKAMQ